MLVHVGGNLKAFLIDDEEEEEPYLRKNVCLYDAL